MSIDPNQIFDGAADAWEELTSTQTSRTGHVAARVASSLANNVDPEVIALQMTMNCQKNNPDISLTFTAGEILTIAKLHAANKTRSALTKQQTGALIREQVMADTEGDLGLPS
ncbi:hypothetical protein VSS37_14830 [Candidatus Thiothrix sp. Deng01]|uniref:Uncharacterized protein n=1 Tax=Candidatus Thiothrix phosphatis TaxID=3112415 RepID=A0ABU6CZK5_9GAMM|nr:hypothetical protein [Candidatus Thiothrix sp. Deng01]MEB4592260.1 hypothetical protein [Candidatus Thiothrix sp. Deng01]